MSRSDTRRWTAALAAASIGIATGVAALATFGVASATSGGTEIDLTDTDFVQPLGDAQIVFSEFDSSTGTGVFESFVRVQASGTERGFNTDGDLQFDELQSSNFTRSLALSAVPLLTDPAGVREFRLDINQTSSNPYLTLETAKIFISTSNDLDDEFDTGTKSFGTDASLVWDMDAGADRYVLMDYNRAPGSGNGDAVLYVDDADFTAAKAAAGCTDDEECFVYLYSEFAATYSGDSATIRTDAVADSAPGAVDVASNDGFEEWSVRKAISSPTVVKSASADFTRTTTWEIDKSVDVDAWNLFDGDDATSEYTIGATKTVTDSNWTVSGTITFLNAGTEEGEITAISDVITPGNLAATVDLDDCTLKDAEGAVIDSSFDVIGSTIEAGESVECSYSASFPSEPEYGELYTNTVTLTFDPKKGSTDPVELTDVEAFQFLDPTTTLGPDSITVTDDLGTADAADDMEFPFDETGSAEPYSVNFTCADVEYDADGHAQYTVTNTASFEDGTDDDVSETVTVDCYLPSVTKDATTSFQRDWTWTIDKSADQPVPPEVEVLLAEGQTILVNYDVTVDAGSTDSDWAVNGSITVSNPNPGRELDVTTVADTISGVGAPLVTPICPADLTVALSATLSCTYAADLPDATARTNTATAAYQNYSFDVNGATPSGTSQQTHTVNVTFDDSPDVEIDECIDVSDTLEGALGTVCADDPLPHTFEYVIEIGSDPAEEPDVLVVCGDNDVDNVADFVTNDTGAVGDDTVSIPVEVTCVFECTLTQGYWKTHNDSFWGGAPTDDTWELIGPLAEQEVFYPLVNGAAGPTYFDVFWTAPQGNPYYNLAHQYIAAELNVLNGAGTTAQVDAALTWARNFFATYTPAQIAALKNKPADKALKAEIIANAGILGAYNEGDLAGEHCTEDATSRLS